MNDWHIYFESEELKPGVELDFIQVLNDGIPIDIPQVGDTLTIEYPNNSRAGGEIITIDSELMEVNIKNISYQLKLITPPRESKEGWLSRCYKLISKNKA